MSLTTPSELHAFLRSIGVRPNRKLSQNFLIDANILHKFLAEAKIEAGDAVLEIGPGPGAITEALIAKKAHVIAIEKDRKFAAALNRFNEIKSIEGDILDYPLETLPSATKVVSNLPFHLTAPILSRLVPLKEKIRSIIVIVQEDVARRMVAQPATSDYSSFSIFLHFYAEVSYAFKISKRCFYPTPKVDAAVVTLTPKEPPPVDPDAFFALVRTAFQQRRKRLTSTLGPQIAESLIALGHPPDARPEVLSLLDFLVLYIDQNPINQ